jgi:hypothetical protein
VTYKFIFSHSKAGWLRKAQTVRLLNSKKRALRAVPSFAVRCRDATRSVSSTFELGSEFHPLNLISKPDYLANDNDRRRLETIDFSGDVRESSHAAILN